MRHWFHDETPAEMRGKSVGSATLFSLILQELALPNRTLGQQCEAGITLQIQDRSLFEGDSERDGLFKPVLFRDRVTV
jgi:hypothetical protein